MGAGPALQRSGFQRDSGFVVAGDSSPGSGLKFLGFETRPLTTQRWEMGTFPGEAGNGQRKSSLPPTLMELAVFSMEKINPNPPLPCPEQNVPLVSLQTAAPAEDDTAAGLGAGQRGLGLGDSPAGLERGATGPGTRRWLRVGFESGCRCDCTEMRPPSRTVLNEH